MATILADDISNAFSWMKMIKSSDSNFTEICFQESNWQYACIGSGNGLAPNRRQAIIWTNADPIHWPIYAALGGDELIALFRPCDQRCCYTQLEKADTIVM